jgi:hypothetical protein
LSGIKDYLLDERTSGLDEAEHRDLAVTAFPALLEKLCRHEGTIFDFNDISNRRIKLIDAKLNLEVIETLSIDSAIDKLNLQTAAAETHDLQAAQNRMERFKTTLVIVLLLFLNMLSISVFFPI